LWRRINTWLLINTVKGGVDEEKLLNRLARRMRAEKRVKDSRLFEVVEEVFDYPTLMALYKLLNAGVIGVMHGAVASGKEARIYWAESPQGEDIAVKIFLVQAAEFRRGRIMYIEGDPRFRRVGRDVREVVEAWCMKEYRNLTRAFHSGVRVPKPIAFKSNVLVMEFIGEPGERGKPAPLLKDALPSSPDIAFQTLKEYVRRLFHRGRLVHADLSEYNIMVRGDELVMIDFGSAVDLRHPMALEFLKRDIRNIYAFFRRAGVDVGEPDEFYEELVASP